MIKNIRKDALKTLMYEEGGKYDYYLKDIATHGMELDKNEKGAAPRSARELLNAKKGEQSGIVKLFVEKYKDELKERENLGRKITQ